MRILIPFKKEVVFKDNISEVTSISLENTLNVVNDVLKGNFLITGEYRITDDSTSVLPFSLDLPLAITLEDKYDTESAVCDIDDFYYEIINNRKLAISIDISVDKLKEKIIKEIKKEEDTTSISDIPLERSEAVMNLEKEIDSLVDELNKEDNNKIINKNDNRCVEEEDKQEEKQEDVEKMSLEKTEITENTEDIKLDNINSIFNNITAKEEYISYTIYIIREGDTIESVLNKYQVDIETIREYNNIDDIKIGDKIIIPTKCEN